MVYGIYMEHEPRRDNEPSEGRFKVSESDVIEYAKKRYGIKMNRHPDDFTMEEIAELRGDELAEYIRLKQVIGIYRAIIW